MEGRSLSERLRDAALERARLDGELVDTYVLDSEGVIDLREFERDGRVPPATQPAAALAETRGMIGEAAEVGELYDEQVDGARRWPFGRKEETAVPPSVRTSPPHGARRSASFTRLSALPLSDQAPPPDQTASADAAPPSPPSIPPSIPEPATAEPEIDLRRDDDVRIDLDALPADAALGTDAATDDRPTRPCPACGGTGRRDLFDRFSQVEFYSCDACVHMWQVKRDT